MGILGGVLVTLIVIMAVGVTSMFASERRRVKEARRADEERRREEVRRAELFDSQCRHLFKVYTWLEQHLDPFKDLGIEIKKYGARGSVENFSIHILRRDSGTMQRYVPILEIDFDFVDRPTPYRGHIHYGAYGPDILFWVGDHSPYNGLAELVLKPVQEEVERIREPSVV